MPRAEQLPPPIEYLPFKDGPFRLAMGLNELKPEHWIEIDRRMQEELALKQQLLKERRAEVFSALPGSDEGSREVLELLAEHLTRYFTEWYTREGRELVNHITGDRVSLVDPPCHPLEAAARCVQEDLCLLKGSGAGILHAACVCFPSRWLLKDKMNQPTRAIHAPVPFYDQTIGATTDRFMELLEPARPVWRLNWTLHDSPALFAPPSVVPPPLVQGETEGGQSLFFRVERQTLRRLPRTRDILFTIRTYVRPLSDFTARPEVCARLAAALRALPPETLQYKSLAPHLPRALEWLEAHPQ